MLSIDTLIQLTTQQYIEDKYTHTVEEALQKVLAVNSVYTKTYTDTELNSVLAAAEVRIAKHPVNLHN